ncbi:MAG TPA: glycosyltransferase [Kiritimatiellia bacterium]|nr:glycosyltransferase [Kiritimatiellia bacterium]HMP34369.1 glycosyltransferase [Kiritimatiellia bacterium]
MSAAVFIGWVAMAGLVYLYIGYPLLVALLARVMARPVIRGETTDRVSVLVSCYGETDRLVEKVRAVLALPGAERICQVLVGLDGEGGGHAEELAGRIGDPRVAVIGFAVRRGKPAVLNDLMSRITGSIVLMLDVRQRLGEQTIPALLSRFADPSVGVVSGELVFVHDLRDTAAAVGIGAYWRYEKWIRKNEAAIASVPGATGALYAIRRQCLRPMPSELVLDDVVLPMQAVVEGWRCVFEPAAVAYDVPAANVRRENIRKRRTIAGCIQLLWKRMRWLLPWVNPIAWQYGSHKILRVLSPWLLLAVLVSSIILKENRLYAAGLIAQGVFYGAGVAALLVQQKRWRLPGVGMVGVFLALQGAILLAWWDWFRGQTRVAWDVSGTQQGSGGFMR